MIEYPKISVLVPMFNSEKYVVDIINDIKAQTYPNFEAIVLDDGSTDNTYRLAMETIGDDTRFKLVHKQNDKYVAIARNFLLTLVTGDYFIFVDSDDGLSPVYLDNLMKTIKETGADIACCAYTLNRVHLDKSNKLKKVKVLKETKPILEKLVLQKKSNVSVWNKLMPSKVLKEMKFDESMHFGEDFVFCFDLFQKDYSIAFISNNLYFYRLLNHGISKGKINPNKVHFIEKLIEMEHDEKYKENRSILTSWIYVTAGLYRFITPRKGEWKETRIRFKQMMKERKAEYKKDKRVPFSYRFLLMFS